MLGRALRSAGKQRAIYRRRQVGNSASVAISLVQQSTTITQLFTGGSTWDPATTTLSGVASGNLVLSLGGWWDSAHGTGGTQSLPTNTNGTFSAGRNPTLPSFTPSPGWPVHCQIGYIASATAGSHVVTPQNIGGSGDGYFLCAEFTGPAGSWTLVDGGDNTNLSGTAGAVDGVSVSTVGTATAVGDLVVVVAVTDGDPTAVGIGSPTTGTWNNLLTTSTTASNIGLGVAWRIATASGTQTADWAWADSDCKLGAAVIAVFRKS